MLMQKKFEHQPQITFPYWTDGYNWVKLNKEGISISKDDRTIYYIPGGDETGITDKEVKRYGNCRFNYPTRTSLPISTYGAHVYLTILKNREQHRALVHHFLKIIFANTSSECLSD
jgi:hypothetical protein